MKKVFICLILIICAICVGYTPTNNVSADFYNNNTLLFTHYNDYASYYDDLTGIEEFSLDDKLIIYTLDKTNIKVLHRATKQVFNIEYTFNNIKDIILTKNYLFVQDNSGLNVFTINGFNKVNIYIDTAKINTIPNYNSYSIAENNDKLTIACINEHKFIAYFLSSKDLSYISTYTNSAINNATHSMLNVVTNSTTAYIINDATNSENSSLWKINYSDNADYSKSLFPKTDIISLIIYTHENMDYLITISSTKAIHVVKTNLNYVSNTEDYTDQTRDGNNSDSRFTKNDINSPNDIILYNNQIYISDIGTKCIQQFEFQVNNDKGSISGTSVVVASECGEVGRYNKNSNIELVGNQLIVADTNNRRVQIFKDTQVTCIDESVLNTLTTNDLSNLKYATIVGSNVYFCTYNTQQKIYCYNLTNSSLLEVSHNILNVLDIVAVNSKVYIVGTNGLFYIDTQTNLCYNIPNTSIFTNAKITNLGSDRLIIASEYNIDLYSQNGNLIKSITTDTQILDIVANNDTLYVLLNNNNLRSYSVKDQEIKLLSTLQNVDENAQYHSISIESTSGIIYLFDNKCCSIDKIINPLFNYKANAGIFQVINKNTCIYDRPYFLNGIDTPNILQKLQVNNRISIYSKTSINYGNIEYYIVDLGEDTFGYINKNDLTYLHDIVNYEVIYPNATIRTFDNSDKVNVYQSNSTESQVLTTVEVNTRVLTIDYKTDEEFTFIRYYDSNQNLVEGYVLTNTINHDDITQTQLTALILIAVSTVLLITILIIVRIFYKKRKKQN